MKSVMYSTAVLTTNRPYCFVTFVNAFFTDEEYVYFLVMVIFFLRDLKIRLTPIITYSNNAV